MKARINTKTPPKRTKTVVEGNVQIVFSAIPKVELNHLLAAAFAGMREYYANTPTQAAEQEGGEMHGCHVRNIAVESQG